MAGDGWVLGACPGGDGADVTEGEDCAGEGVFEGDEPRGAGVDVGGEDGVVLDVREGEVVGVGGGDGDGEGAREGGQAACFPDFSGVLSGSRGRWEGFEQAKWEGGMRLMFGGERDGQNYQPMMCDRASATMLWGGPPRWVRMLNWLPMVPLMTSRAASWPVRSAIQLSRSLVVGSSRKTSSRRVVFVTAASMEGVGVVTTSPAWWRGQPFGLETVTSKRDPRVKMLRRLNQGWHTAEIELCGARRRPGIV